MQHGETVVDLTIASQSLVETIDVTLECKSMAQLVAADEDTLHRVWALAEQAAGESVACRALAEVKPLAPLPEPRRNIICLGKNYREHAKEMAHKMGTDDAPPKHPIFFTKATTAIIGTGESIPAHSEITNKLDYEAELAIIIGKGGKTIHRLTNDMSYVYNIDNPQIDVQEIKVPELNAQMMANRLANALERGWYFRKAGYNMLRRIMDSGALGCEIVLSGKFTGPRSKVSKMVEGYIKHAGKPAEELVDTGFATAVKKLGTIIIKTDITRTKSIRRNADIFRFMLSSDVSV